MRFLNRLPDYSDEALLAELRRLARLLGRDRLCMRDLAGARVSYDTLRARFGGLHAALRLAGLAGKVFPRAIPDEELLRELQRVWDAVSIREGRRPWANDLRAYGARYSRYAYLRRWGSWLRACEALLAWEEKMPSPPVGPSLPAEEPPGHTPAEPAGLARRALGGGGAAAPATDPSRPPCRRCARPPRRPLPVSLRYQVLCRDEYRCVLCGRSPATHPGLQLHVDHILPWIEGGAATLDNLRTLCADCNLGKGSGQ
jgi:hypothetical protein